MSEFKVRDSLGFLVLIYGYIAMLLLTIGKFILGDSLMEILSFFGITFVALTVLGLTIMAMEVKEHEIVERQAWKNHVEDRLNQLEEKVE